MPGTGSSASSPYILNDLDDFRHTKTLRIDVRIRAIDLDVHAFLQTLAHIMPGLVSVRKVQLYAEPLDYSHDDDFGPYKTGGGS
jgi:hypothetical protein